MSDPKVIHLQPFLDLREREAQRELDELIEAGLVFDKTTEHGSKPGGIFHVNELEDGALRFTLTVPMGEDPIQFFARAYTEFEERLSPF